MFSLYEQALSYSNQSTFSSRLVPFVVAHTMAPIPRSCVDNDSKKARSMEKALILHPCITTAQRTVADSRMTLNNTL